MTTPRPIAFRVRALLAVLALAATAGLAQAAGATGGIEQLLAAAQQDRRGVTLYVAGQAVSGAVTRIEPGQWVELRNAQYGRILVRLERIDGVAAP